MDNFFHQVNADYIIWFPSNSRVFQFISARQVSHTAMAWSLWLMKRVKSSQLCIWLERRDLVVGGKGSRWPTTWLMETPWFFNWFDPPSWRYTPLSLSFHNIIEQVVIFRRGILFTSSWFLFPGLYNKGEQLQWGQTVLTFYMGRLKFPTERYLFSSKIELHMLLIISSLQKGFMLCAAGLRLSLVVPCFSRKFPALPGEKLKDCVREFRSSCS